MAVRMLERRGAIWCSAYLDAPDAKKFQTCCRFSCSDAPCRGVPAAESAILRRRWTPLASAESASSSALTLRAPAGRRARLHELHRLQRGAHPRASWRRPAGRVTSSPARSCTGSITAHGGTTTDFRVRDRKGQASVPVSYTGALPDPFREGREVIVTVRAQGGAFVGERDSLVTKCPSKFTAETQKPEAGVADLGRGLPDPRARRRPLRHRRLALRRAQRPARRGSTSGRRAVYALAGLIDGGVRGPRDRVPALGLLLLGRRDALLDDDAAFYKRPRSWSSQEGSLLLWLLLLSIWSSLCSS